MSRANRRPDRAAGRPPESDLVRETDWRLEDFDYELPEDRIARLPSPERSQARMLVVRRDSGAMRDERVENFAEHIRSGDCVVLNDTRVLKARLIGKKKTGGKIEALLHRPLASGPQDWEALLRPPLAREGDVIFFENGGSAIYLGKTASGLNGLRFVEETAEVIMRRAGKMPLPPYIDRETDSSDEIRYQTVFAKNDGSIAAPTAGLHLDWPLLERIRSAGASLAWVTLHVGYGTFQTVRDIQRHQMHREFFRISQETADIVNATKRAGGRIWAVGTTATRALETCAVNGLLAAGSGETDLFILPPFEFEIVGGLLTNFHLPKSTLLMLVSAWMGQDLRQKAYRHAVESDYRFYSYGDAMLVY